MEPAVVVTPATVAMPAPAPMVAEVATVSLTVGMARMVQTVWAEMAEWVATAATWAAMGSAPGEVLYSMARTVRLRCLTLLSVTTSHRPPFRHTRLLPAAAATAATVVMMVAMAAMAVPAVLVSPSVPQAAPVAAARTEPVATAVESAAHRD